MFGTTGYRLVRPLLECGTACMNSTTGGHGDLARGPSWRSIRTPARIRRKQVTFFMRSQFSGTTAGLRCPRNSPFSPKQASTPYQRQHRRDSRHVTPHLYLISHTPHLRLGGSGVPIFIFEMTARFPEKPLCDLPRAEWKQMQLARLRTWQHRSKV